MILEHGGVTVNFFQTFPRDYKRIGLHLSGGADSALILYLLVKMIQERKDNDVLIYPITGYDVSSPAISNYIAAENVINWIQDKTNYNLIQPLIVAPYTNKDDTKDDMIRSTRNYLAQRYCCEVVLDGTSLGMPNSPRSGPVGYQWVDDEQIRGLSIKYPHLFPWATVTKQFIAAQYKKFGIEELSMITNSCINNSVEPCRECWWCQERYWAFGSYDGGIQ